MKEPTRSQDLDAGSLHTGTSTQGLHFNKPCPGAKQQHGRGNGVLVMRVVDFDLSAHPQSPCVNHRGFSPLSRCVTGNVSQSVGLPGPGKTQVILDGTEQAKDNRDREHASHCSDLRILAADRKSQVSAAVAWPLCLPL